MNEPPVDIVGRRQPVTRANLRRELGLGIGAAVGLVERITRGLGGRDRMRERMVAVGSASWLDVDAVLVLP